jgi:uncharacterized membrane protein
MISRASRRVIARYNWDRLKVSFWFAPAVMALGAVLLGRAMYWVDALIPNAILLNSHLIVTGSVDQMRADLLNISATTLATAGVVFTLLTLPLSTVVSQYGSRLLRLFLGDRTTQFVLGMFVATFVYCLSAAISIPPVEIQPNSPQIMTTVGLYLMMATFATLILLVQHISTMLQAPNIAAAAGAKLVELVGADLPDVVTSVDNGKGEFQISSGSQDLPDEATIIRGGMETDGYAVRIRRTGYIQYIDPETIIALAQNKNMVIRLQRKPGHFVWRGEVVALLWPAGRVDEKLEEKVLMTFRVGNSRTLTQDIGYAVNLLVEMAVRAMSPAINDPFTAMTCLDYLAVGLALFIRQREKGSHYYDLKGRLRLVFEPDTFEELLNAAFDMLRHASCDNIYVLLHMLEAIEVIGQDTKPPEARQMLARQVSLIQAESQASRLIENDRQLLQQRGEALVMKLSSVG